MIEQDRNTNRGHPPDSIQVSPGSQTGKTVENKGTGEKERGKRREARGIETKAE